MSAVSRRRSPRCCRCRWPSRSPGPPLRPAAGPDLPAGCRSSSRSSRSPAPPASCWLAPRRVRRPGRSPTTWAAGRRCTGRALGIAFAADPFGLTFALAAASIGAVLLLLTAVRARRPRPAGARRLRLPVPAAARRADRRGAHRRPVQPVRLVRGRRAGQLRPDRLLPGAPDRARGGVQDPGPDHPGQLRHLHRRRRCSTPTTARSTSASCTPRWPATRHTADLVALGAADRRLRDQGRAGPVPRLAGRRAHRRAGPGVRAVLRR